MQTEQEPVNNELSKFKEFLNNQISRLQSKSNADKLNNFIWLSPKDVLDYANTTIRVSYLNRNKLKNLLKPEETYDALIVRLINVFERFQEEKMKELNQQQTNLIELHAREFIRQNDTLQYYPDVKIEYSYNESLFIGEGFIFDLNINHILLKGLPLNDVDGIRLLGLINKIKDFREIINRSRIDQILDTTQLAIQDRFELIKTKYITYFKVLYLLTNKNLKKKYSDINELTSAEFWKRIYSYYDLPNSSFEHDVLQKIKNMELELEQEKMNLQKTT